MEEKLIEEVKKHTVLYKKGSQDYKNKKKRAEAWNCISKVLNIPESACQTRWKTLRDRFVKEFNKIHFASGSACEIIESQWIYFTNMQFLHEQILPRKTKSSILSDHFDTIEDNADVNFDGILSDDSFVDYSDCVITSIEDSSNEKPSTSKRSRKRSANSEDLSDFLTKMSSIAEKRFCSRTNEVSEDDKHKGFFLMVQDLFKKVPDSLIDESKIFFINYLHNLIKDSSGNVKS